MRIAGAFILFLTLWCFCACKHETLKPKTATNPTTLSDNYPDDISKIVINRCATAGCHNSASYENAGGLLMDSWDHLFDGGKNGAVVIPYDIENSSLLYFINTFADLGPTALPLMPLDQPALSREEYIQVRDWIAKGAPDKNGNIPFASNAATRQKIYVTHQGCDLIGVIDGEKKVVMRYIKVGGTLNNEISDYVKISTDGQYAYACFWNGNTIQKIDLSTDSVVAEAKLPEAYWKNIFITPDGQRLLATTWQSATIVAINTGNMQVEQTYTGFQYPESMAGNTMGTYYVTERFGNTLCKLSANGNIQKISLDGKPLTTIPAANTPNPYRILMSADNTKYFVTCENTNELRVFDAQTDNLIKVIPTGRMPQEMAQSRTHPYLFVTCTNDTIATGVVGSVYAINYNTWDTKRLEGKLFQPHGIAVDDRNGLLYVFSRNQDKSGPQPHHISPCNGRNGFYNLFSTSTLLPYNNSRYEILVDPYSADVRFK
ncbi:c-type cytochrome domain-containing protein [Polluticoccus soli]|uniref:c-type cytochrome domain-containing protein n=1 Tax=Polluticoccus soli TaxID=3034150 RepID=UPI0023E19A23|nr:c-type cytochrome domain-containing protein [Flavipsychrobacter sp. JY13-12]